MLSIKYKEQKEKLLRDPFDICNESMTYVSDDFIAGIYKYKYKYIDIYILKYIVIIRRTES